MKESKQGQTVFDKERRAALEAAIGRLPRTRLAALPTPLEECPRLSAALGEARVFIKRDDLTGLAFGGNKSRQLEFVLGQAQAEGVDVLLATAAIQSNLCRQVAAAACKLGMRCVLVLRGQEPPARQGNLLLDQLLGADVRFVDTADLSVTDEVLRQIALVMRREGHKPLIINRGWTLGPYGAAGYVNCALELSDQMQAQGIAANYVYLVCGSTTHAGLLLGLKWLGVQTRVVGINLAPRRPAHELIVPIGRETAELLGIDTALLPEEVRAVDDYVGGGYGVLTEEVVEAVRLLARTEGILVDPVYTGKALSGLIGDVRRGRIGPGETAVFLHTGGTPALFAYAQQLEA